MNNIEWVFTKILFFMLLLQLPLQQVQGMYSFHDEEDKIFLDYLNELEKRIEVLDSISKDEKINLLIDSYAKIIDVFISKLTRNQKDKKHHISSINLFTSSKKKTSLNVFLISVHFIDFVQTPLFLNKIQKILNSLGESIENKYNETFLGHIETLLHQPKTLDEIKIHIRNFPNILSESLKLNS